MTENDINKKIAKAINNSVPDVLDNVLSQCDEKGKVIMLEERKNNRGIVKLMSLAAAVLIIVGAVGFINMQSMDSTVFLDVNPSIELSVNKSERIKDAKALNSDAAKILYGMDLEDTDLEVGVNAIIGSMLKNGYLSDISNSILVSVENKDEAKNMELQDKITNQINEVLGGAKLDAAVLSQKIDKETPEIKNLCDTYGISKGKAELIKSIMEKDPALTEEKLAGLTINELNLIMNSKNIEVEEVSSKGEPSTKKYIGEEKAVEIALKKLGFAKEAAQKLDVSMDSENNELVYEVEILKDGKEYEIEVNALDGRIVSHEVKNAEKKPEIAAPEDSPKEKLSEESAKTKILAEFKISPDKAGYIDIELDEEDGRMVYEAEFKAGKYKYSMTIDAYTGEVLEREAKEVKLSVIEGGKPVFGKIDVDSVIDTLLNDMGISKSQAGYIDIDMDMEDGKPVFEAEFKVNGREYSFKIDADTGKILDREEEEEDKKSSGNNISEEKAIDIALSSVGETKGNIFDLDVEADDDSIEVTFKSDGKEYSIEIDSKTGEILENESEKIDSEDEEDDKDDDDSEEKDDD